VIETVFFYVFSLAAVACAISVVVQASPIASALSLVGCFFCLAADYVLLDAHFVAVIQLLVYAGAIMVLFIFVIMLLNLRHDGPLPIAGIGGRALAGIAAAGFMGVGLLALLDRLASGPGAALPPDFGTTRAVGLAMFAGPYLLPFEAVSLLLTIGMIGAVVLARKEI
jgi:NADH-quinone oxidoreductase subunit J